MGRVNLLGVPFVEGALTTFQRDTQMKKTLSALTISLIALSAQASDIKLTIDGSGEAAKEYSFKASTKPFVIDQRVAKKYDSHVGCKNFDTSKLISEVAVGRKIEVIQEGATSDGAWLAVKSSNTEFKGINPFKVSAECTVNNSTSTTKSAESHLYLKRGEPVTIEPGVTLLFK